MDIRRCTGISGKKIKETYQDTQVVCGVLLPVGLGL